LPSILPSAVTGTVRYVREKLILWRVVYWTAPAGIAASIAGSLLSKVVPGHGHWLMVFTAALLGVTAWRMSRPPPTEAPVPETDDEVLGVAVEGPLRATAPVLVAIGASAGLLSGLLGIGGGVIMVPAFTEGARLPLRSAIATSLVCVGIFALPGTITHAALGDINWRVALLLSVAVVPGARLGAVVAIRASDRRLRLAVAGFLGLLSIGYAVGELLALR
jgi:uncharacterized membrane protein YfcA